MRLPSLTNKSAELLEASALFAIGQLTHAEGAALAGLSADEFTTELENPETLTQLETHLARMKISGKLTEARALAMLDKLVVNIESQIDGEMSAAMASRLAELMLRISGLPDRRAAEIKRATPQDGNKFSITIILPEKDATHRSEGVTLDGEAVEVFHG